jgi:hypothetical protein
MILNSELKAKNETAETGVLSIPLLRHSFGIINWGFEKI